MKALPPSLLVAGLVNGKLGGAPVVKTIGLKVPSPTISSLASPSSFWATVNLTGFWKSAIGIVNSAFQTGFLVLGRVSV